MFLLSWASLWKEETPKKVKIITSAITSTEGIRNCFYWFWWLHVKREHKKKIKNNILVSSHLKLTLKVIHWKLVPSHLELTLKNNSLKVGASKKRRWHKKKYSILVLLIIKLSPKLIFYFYFKNTDKNTSILQKSYKYYLKKWRYKKYYFLN